MSWDTPANHGPRYRLPRPAATSPRASTYPVPKDGATGPPARSQGAWARGAGYVTIGSTRYGVRLAAEAPPPRGHQHRDDGECCCGGVQLPWGRSRIPLPSINSGSAVQQRGSSQQDGGPLTMPRRVLVRPKPDLPAYLRLCGGAPSDDRGKRAPAPRSSDKAERLRQLTERLKGSAPRPAPPPEMKEDDVLECVSLRLAKPESRPVVGSYAQRTIPFRSASFSQVDFSSADGKYIRSAPKAAAVGGSLTLPRKKAPDAEEPAGSTPSVDSAVGSDEGSVSKIPETPDAAATHKAPGARSLTYPLPRRGSRPDDDIPFSSIDGNGLKSLQHRELQEVTEETEASQAGCNEDVESPQPAEKSGEIFVTQWPNGERTEDWQAETPEWDSAQEESQSPEETPRWLEKPKLVYQSSEEREDDGRPPPPARADSLSEGESDQGERPSAPSPAPLSDSEGRPHTPRRYSKRPLRGPYGQMLEAEMSKAAESSRMSRLQLEFLDKIVPPPRSLDDSQLAGGYGRASPKRKVSANIPYQAPQSPPPPPPQPCHQRTTSSPSQLEGCAAPRPELLAELLRGSSERVYSKDTRTHVVVEIYDTERSYVESLQILVMKYLQPLKSPENAGLVDAAVVDEIFYQVPAILAHHEVFLEELRKRLEHWDIKQKVGDVFLDVFTKQAVIETYTLFLNNWKKSKETIKNICQAKPAFARFLEAMAREHKGKLALDCLLIMPVQRIPRYELLIQTLLKHTDPSHPDHQLLQEAQKEVHDLAVKINCTERETLKELEALIEGLMNLVAAERTFVRHDLVTMVSGQGTRKERALFLFSDLLVITSIKRRSGTIRKPSTSCPGSVASTLEANKYKLLMRIPLDDLEIVKAKDENLRRMMSEMEHLAEDVATLNQITDLTASLHCQHSQLEEVVRDLLASINKQLAERQTSDSQLSYLELTLNTQNGIENLSVVFTKPEKRTSWEESFNEAKQKLALSADRRPSPEFLSPLPIRKTRAGLQFTCAAPTLGLNAYNMRDVWVCNSDGYVGQVCVLSLQPEPTVISCNGVCNARILCIASIPVGVTGPSSGCSIGEPFMNSKAGISISVEDTDDSGGNTVQLDSSSSSEDEDEGEEGPAVNIGVEEEQKRIRSASDSLACESSDDADSLQPTMWLGTEDGCIHVYNCSDNIRIKKNKVKIQHGSSVHSIIYLDNRVFVSLANGDITVYVRDHTGGWNTTDPYTVSVGTAAMPVTRMLPIAGKLWCGCHNAIKILNTASLEVEHSFQVNSDSGRAVTCMALSGLGVWISLQNSAVIRLFHATSYEFLCDVNVAPAVTKMLASCDDIIRQHKAACLRVTSLLACKDLLWIGTSAGVILTMPLPHISSATTKLANIPNATGVPHGHTGHVRFLTFVETVPSQSSEGLMVRPSTHHRYSLKSKTDLQSSSNSNVKLLVISGGDGYEDFRTSSVSEVAGREDSTNHLLLWHV
ncbi:rho guanine nucleotide exchange factor 17 isoform X2 [Periplaneta americana]|uniref:rho guanine nucleotide exchange factor 17 isoform X2 n=1 Tax=Periplaneta americana TaxID=6978 RepID=UPI0037E7F14B